MKNFLSAGLALFISILCFGQQLPKALNNDTTAYKYSPLFVIHILNKPVKQYASTDIMKQINPNDIKAIYVQNNLDSIKMYGPDARYGLLNIYTNEQVKMVDTILYNFTAIKKAYKIRKSNLPVYVDSDLVIHPERILLMPKTINMAKVYKETETGKEYINIMTNEAEIKARTKREHWIR